MDGLWLGVGLRDTDGGRNCGDQVLQERAFWQLLDHDVGIGFVRSGRIFMSCGTIVSAM
jgi:hypothetical protein